MTALYTRFDKRRRADPPVRVHLRRETYRSAFRRDYARLIHSSSFRRLQGKTQVFPAVEADFFRNRLTHSLEVAQIAKSIAIRLNNSHDYFRKNQIDTDLVELAGLAHDLGHPPFGHNGERALDDCMKQVGGFEGNAQTLHIVSRTEKKDLMHGFFDPVGQNGEDQRLGLNWCFRSMASVIKYDNIIPKCRQQDAELEKGVYEVDKEIFFDIKSSMAGSVPEGKKFRTIECSIMDLADDIAYSTYDLEDILKAGFQTPLDILGASSELLGRVAAKVSKKLRVMYDEEAVTKVLIELFEGLQEDTISQERTEPSALVDAVEVHNASKNLADNGYLRTKFTSDLVSEMLSGVKVTVDEQAPALSCVRLARAKRVKMETLKNFTFESIIMSSRLRVPEQRGYDIVMRLFQKLESKGGHLLLPEDFRRLYESFRDHADQKRVICNYIAGMTDRYAVEFYGRMFSETPQSMFKPF